MQNDLRGLADQIVQIVFDDLNGRRGIGDALVDIDEEIWYELYNTNVDLVEKVLSQNGVHFE